MVAVTETVIVVVDVMATGLLRLVVVAVVIMVGVVMHAGCGSIVVLRDVVYVTDI